jgi:hypothetical protein
MGGRIIERIARRAYLRGRTSLRSIDLKEIQGPFKAAFTGSTPTYLIGPFFFKFEAPPPNQISHLI